MDFLILPHRIITCGGFGIGVAHSLSFGAEEIAEVSPGSDLARRCTAGAPVECTDRQQHVAAWTLKMLSRIKDAGGESRGPTLHLLVIGSAPGEIDDGGNGRTVCRVCG